MCKPRLLTGQEQKPDRDVYSTKASCIELQLVSISTVGAQQHQDLSTRLDNLDTHCSEIRDAVAAQTEAQTGAMENLENLVSQLRNLSLENNFGPSTRAPIQQPQTSPQPPRPLNRPFQTISFHTTQRKLCPRGCPCRCHRQDTPSFQVGRGQSGLFSVLGSLFVRYTGWPFGLWLCDQTACNAKRHTRVEAAYTFPAWFIWSTVHIMIDKMVGRGPELLLAVLNRVTLRGSPLLLACHLGDVDLVAKICRETPWHLRDINGYTGSNALSVAYDAGDGGHLGKLQIVKALVDAGINIDCEDDSGQSIRSRLAFLVLSGDPELLSPDWCHILKISDFLEDLVLPELTAAILQLPGSLTLQDWLLRSSAANLQAQLNLHDQVDATPLMWACSRGDSGAVGVLLELGADFRVTTRDGITALHFATGQPNSFSCVNLLLTAGAELSTDHGGRSPLHLACGHLGNVDTVLRLLDAGADVDQAANDRCCTPVHIAARWNNVDVLDILLNRCESKRENPLALWHALEGHAHACVELLLSRGYSYDGLEVRFAARWSDAGMLRLLSQYPQEHVDVLERVTDGFTEGFTVQECFDQRINPSDELKAAFAGLLDVLLWE